MHANLKRLQRSNRGRGRAATRGAGRGIAEALGEAGAAVYLHGASTHRARWL